tara:strand:+ start:288 stop:1016 length:729 start_codon:yes stop_codon:yes gene_type:complete
MAGIDVKNWDFHKWSYGDHGPMHAWLGSADITEARRQGASQHQLWQLYDRAHRESKEQVAAGWWPGPQGQYAVGVEIGLGNKLGARPTAPGGHVFENYDDSYGLGMGSIQSVGTLAEKEALRDYALAQKLTIGPGVESHISGLKQKSWYDEQTKALTDTNAELIKLAQEAVKPQEPPKPTMPGPSGHFVPGTTRVQGYTSAQRGAGSRTKKSRFGRQGKGFQSALAIASGNQGATESKVLNV